MKLPIEQHGFRWGMSRREAISRLALLMGSAVLAPHILSGSGNGAGKRSAADFSDDDRALLDEIGETIIPATDTPGAKAVGIGAFMIMIVNDCFNDEHQVVFKEGLTGIDAACAAKHGTSFMKCAPDQRTALLNELDKEQRSYSRKKTKTEPEHYFRLMKNLTILGYFTSEIGCTQALRNVEVPTAFKGDEPYKKGDRAWFIHPSRISSEF